MSAIFWRMSAINCPPYHTIQSTGTSQSNGAQRRGDICRLEDLTMSDQVFLDNCFTQYLDTIYLQEVTDSTNAIIDKVLDEAGDEGFRIMTDVAVAEFEMLWDIVQVSLKSRWTDRCGCKPAVRTCF
ncbi:hypothetical protein AaE_008671 [Aphanomyces astaci]|uniref:Uncharacterized protein n=1 Tax=Aphanomyces astaci TaxID=112090 RepID=A0A6A5AAL6_APHAT|nr:hypothetical protein AaE_008671 [Aphanomyces astaci]